MREVLVILTKNDPLVSELAEMQREMPEQHVEIVDFTRAEPDYDAALEKIFRADSVQVW